MCASVLFFNAAVAWFVLPETKNVPLPEVYNADVDAVKGGKYPNTEEKIDQKAIENTKNFVKRTSVI